MASKETTTLITKCIKFYIDSLTEAGSKCPKVEAMREIVQLDDIVQSLEKKPTDTPKS